MIAATRITLVLRALLPTSLRMSALGEPFALPHSPLPLHRPVLKALP